MSALDKLDYYTLLQVADDATVPEIKRAFRKFAKRYHPDRFAGKPPEKVEQAAEIYRRGSEAFQVLSMEETRKEYDLGLRTGRIRLSAEEQARALAPEVDVPKKKEHPIKSPQALVYFRQGVKAANEGDLRACWRLLKQALAEEPGNPFIRARLKKVQQHLRGF